MSKLTQAELDSQAGAQQTDAVVAGTPDVAGGKLSAVFPSYARYDISLVKGKGSWVWDDKGNKYLDFTCGLAVTSLGHAPEKVGAKLKDQIDTLWHVSNLFHIPGQDKVAKLLTENSCADQVFFCNSGAEANEAAIKLARRYHQKIKGVERYEVITFEQSFHGRTLATLTATGQQKVKEGFLPLPAGFKTVPLHNLPALEAAIGDHTAAIMASFSCKRPVRYLPISSARCGSSSSSIVSIVAAITAVASGVPPKVDA